MTGSKLYPVTRGGKTVHVTVPGSGDLGPGPATEADLEVFLAEAIEVYAESSDVIKPDMSTFTEAGVLTRNRGLVVRFGDATFQIRIVRSR